MEALVEWNFGNTSEIANWKPCREDLPPDWRPVVFETKHTKGNGKQRRAILAKAAAQWWFCFHCCIPMTPKVVTRDHLVPKCKGGKGGDNIVAACSHCNRKKGDSPEVPSWYLYKRRRQYFMTLGIWCKRDSKGFARVHPNFGKGPDGEPLWAPQYGIV